MPSTSFSVEESEAQRGWVLCLRLHSKQWQSPKPAVWASCGFCNELPQTGGLKQQEFILSWFRRPEVQNQGVGRAVLCPEALREDLSLLLPASGGSRCTLACGHITPISASPFIWPSLIKTPVIGFRDLILKSLP